MKIGIINYGSGNLSAFINVFKSLDKESIIVMNLKDLDTCSHILMPGVSAWDTTMKSVENFRDALIHSVFIQKKTFFGSLCWNADFSIIKRGRKLPRVELDKC